MLLPVQVHLQGRYPTRDIVRFELVILQCHARPLAEMEGRGLPALVNA
jgi:hypothetical protein